MQEPLLDVITVLLRLSVRYTSRGSAEQNSPHQMLPVTSRQQTLETAALPLSARLTPGLSSQNVASLITVTVRESSANTDASRTLGTSRVTQNMR